MRLPHSKRPNPIWTIKEEIGLQASICSVTDIYVNDGIWTFAVAHDSGYSHTQAAQNWW